MIIHSQGTSGRANRFQITRHPSAAPVTPSSGTDRRRAGCKSEQEKEAIVPIILWLLGVPLGLVLVLWLFGVV